MRSVFAASILFLLLCSSGASAQSVLAGDTIRIKLRVDRAWHEGSYVWMSSDGITLRDGLRSHRYPLSEVLEAQVRRRAQPLSCSLVLAVELGVLSSIDVFVLHTQPLTRNKAGHVAVWTSLGALFGFTYTKLHPTFWRNIHWRPGS